VTRSEIRIPVDGAELAGWLYRPAATAAPPPVIVMSHGFSALKEMALPRYADLFAAAGFACVVYDHRNLGQSSGALRGEIDPWAQIRDMRAVIGYAAALDRVDPARIGLWGTSYSGGHVLVVAALDRRVRCVVAQVFTVDGFAAVQGRTPADAARQFAERVTADIAGRAAGAAPARVPVAPSGTDSYAFLVSAYPELAYPNEVTLQSREMARSYVPGAFVPKIAPTPLLMVAAENDTTTPTDLQRAAFATAGEPKRLVVVPDCGHYGVYIDRFDESALPARDWFLQHLTGQGAAP
jgi:dipeptidyl aminopeptidase/acylaminoacyl peptidase